MLTIQHMHGPSNDPADLKTYCRQCNTIEALRFVTARQLVGYNAEQLARLNLLEVKNPDAIREPHIEILMREIRLRVQARVPVLQCDDADGWKTRFKRLQTLRRDHINAQRVIAAKLFKAERAISSKPRRTSDLRNARTSVEAERANAETIGAAKLGQMLRSLRLCS
jgi:hypothetical protein